ncbi:MULTISPECIES: ElyC/SanA/YdcF family protein [unclassified Actinomyces]|uniref:SanA/YdcF family protein n=1 Tax=unclassified Actinomyces TaxID=2609248 RepID=UPI002892F8D0|nr:MULTISPECIES: ElyC/SanA/YdcF family protein [unclassified Actinomyces]
MARSTGGGPGGGARGRLRRVAWALLGVAVVLTAAANTWVWAASAGRLREAGSGDEDATAPVAIVLGARVHPSGRSSPWLAHRLDVAADLYLTGRVDALLVSGAGGGRSHDEPGAMRDHLVAAGVPAEAVVLDRHGYDTRDTCVRAREVFGVSRALVVTQDFHAPRAVALCRQAGIDAQGVADTRARANRATWLRSWLEGARSGAQGRLGRAQRARAGARWARGRCGRGRRLDTRAPGTRTPSANPGPRPGTHID